MSTAAARTVFGFVIGLASIVVLVSCTSTPGDSQEPSVSCESTVAAGVVPSQTVCGPQYPSDPGNPERYGPFRILPFGYFATGATPDPTKCPDFAQPEGETIVASPLYVSGFEVPPQFKGGEGALPEVTELCGSTVRGLQWEFDGPDANQLRITRELYTEPFEVRDVSVDSWLVLEKGAIAGDPALFLRTRSGAPGVQRVFAAGPTTVTVIEGGATLEELIDVANDVVAAAKASED